MAGGRHDGRRHGGRGEIGPDPVLEAAILGAGGRDEAQEGAAREGSAARKARSVPRPAPSRTLPASRPALPIRARRAMSGPRPARHVSTGPRLWRRTMAAARPRWQAPDSERPTPNARRQGPKDGAAPSPSPILSRGFHERHPRPPAHPPLRPAAPPGGAGAESRRTRRDSWRSPRGCRTTASSRPGASW